MGLDMITSIVSSIAVAAAAAGIATSIRALFVGRRSRGGPAPASGAEISESIVADVQRQIDTLSAAIAEAEVPKKQAIEMETFIARVNKLESDFRDLRRLLFDNPEAVVSIPLMRKDVDSFRRDNENLRKELERIGSLSRWFIGIMITLSIGLLGLAVSILLKA